MNAEQIAFQEILQILHDFDQPFVLTLSRRGSLLALTFLPSLIEALHDQADDHQDSSSRTLINGGDIERVT
ncbi:MAG TPA: hypothetical protein VIT23_16350 [Terrimicrobiaceae bacterium]